MDTKWLGCWEWKTFRQKATITASKEDNGKSFVVTIIDGEHILTVEKLWKDFVELNDAITQEFESRYPLPKFPTPSILERFFTNENMEGRCEDLQLYTNSLLRHPIFSQSIRFRRFITPKPKQIFLLPDPPETMEFIEYIIYSGLRSMMADLHSYFKLLSTASHVMNRSLSPVLKRDFIEDQKESIEKCHSGLHLCVQNLKTLDRPLDVKQDFRTYCTTVKAIVLSAESYANFLITCDKAKELVGFQEDKWGFKIFLQPLAESKSTIVLHRSTLLATKIKSIQDKITSVSERMAPGLANPTKREIEFELRMIGYEITALQSDYIPQLDSNEYNDIPKWLNSLRELQQRVDEILLSINDKAVQTESSNPYFNVVASISLYENELNKLNELTEFESEQQVRSYQNSLDNLNKKLSKIRLSLQKLDIPEVEAGKFCDRLNELQEQVTDLIRSTVNKYGDTWSIQNAVGDKVKEYQVKSATNQHILVQDSMYVL